MVETLHQLAKNSYQRVEAAKQLRNFRKIERASKGPDSPVIERRMMHYVDHFAGLQYYFDYIRELDCARVLDIGAGTTVGIGEISKSSLGEGLSFWVTVLTRHKDISLNLGDQRAVTTSAEVLRGFENSSIGGVLALYSIAYSAVPELTIQRIDQVLVEGGVLKAVLPSEFDIIQEPEKGLQSDIRFSRELVRLGYDCSVTRQMTHNVMLAIKPGRKNIPAKELLGKDKNAYWENFKRSLKK